MICVRAGVLGYTIFEHFQAAFSMRWRYIDICRWVDRRFTYRLYIFYHSCTIHSPSFLRLILEGSLSFTISIHHAYSHHRIRILPKPFTNHTVHNNTAQVINRRISPFTAPSQTLHLHQHLWPALPPVTAPTPSTAHRRIYWRIDRDRHPRLCWFRPRGIRGGCTSWDRLVEV